MPMTQIDDVKGYRATLGTRAKAAARQLGLASSAEKDAALRAAAKAFRQNAATLLAANAQDLAAEQGAGKTEVFLDRLTLTPDRIAAMADAIAAQCWHRCGALCLKSGNAVILRGGSESLNSTRVIVACLRQGLHASGLPSDCVQMVQTPDRHAFLQLLRAVETVDLAIPHARRGLVGLAQREARVPSS